MSNPDIDWDRLEDENPGFDSGSGELRFTPEFSNGTYPRSSMISVPGGGWVLANRAGYSFLNMIAAAQAAGITIRLSEGGAGTGYRDMAGQQATWATYQNGGNLAAEPGTSNHGHGLALDIADTPGARAWINQNGSEYGWYGGRVAGEPWHFEHESAWDGTGPSQLGGDGSSFGPGGGTGTAPPAGGGGPGGVDNPGDFENAANLGSGSTTVDAAPADWVPPGGGRLFRHPRLDNHFVVRYQVAPGVFVEYATNDVEALRRGGYRPNGDRVRDYQRIVPGEGNRRDDVEVMNFRNTGDLSEMAWIAEQGYDTLGEWYEEAILSAFGTARAGRDTGVQAVMLEILQNPEISEDRIQLLIEQTDYWNERNTIQAEWDDLSDAEKDARQLRVAQDIAESHRRIVGLVDGRFITMHDRNIMRFARMVARGEMTMGQVITQFEEAAIDVEDSPYAREVRNEEQLAGAFDVDVENMAEDLRGRALAWGVYIADDQLSDWAQRIAMNTNSDADFDRMLETQARVQYPNMPQGIRTDTYAAPFLSTLARIMEVGTPTLEDPRVQQALQSGMTMFDFERQLKSSEDWLYTGNAADEIVGAFGDAAQMMGFA